MKPIETQKKYQEYVEKKSPNSPILKNTERMCKILSDLSNSQDDLWIFATNLN